MPCEYLSLGLHVGNHSRPTTLSIIFSPRRMGCEAWAWFLHRFPVIIYSSITTGFFSAGFFWPPSNHGVLIVVAQLLLEELRRQCLDLHGFFVLDYLFTELCCSTKTCKVNLMFHYALCLLRSEAEIEFIRGETISALIVHH